MRTLRVAITVIALCVVGTSARGEQDASARDASRHFQRGVDLYNDGDYRGALVEFKKAYVLLPRANVLYDIGETEYQLQDYASALKTLERFIAETGPGTAHRSEVEETVEILRTRVGRVALTADVSGCDVLIDDQSQGQTPVGRPILVSVGSRKVGLNCAGRPQVSKRVEIAGGETMRVDLKVPAATAMTKAPAGPSENDRKAQHQSNVNTAWTVTAALAATTIGLYTAALVESSQLSDLKQRFPTDQGALDTKSKWTTGLAISGDVFAGATAAALCVSAYLTWASPDDHSKVHVAVSPTGIALSGRF
jgi:tetratricopeptide (TPR) repeat protein